MAYPGGKNGAGVYQKIINLMPPHQVYIEPFLGGAAIMRLKRPAALNIGIDLVDPAKLPMAGPLASVGDPGTIGVFGGAGLRADPRASSSDKRSPIAISGERRRRAPSILAGSAETFQNGDTAGKIVISGDCGSASTSAGSSERARPRAGTPEAGDAAAFRFHQEDGIAFLKGYKFTGKELVYCDPPYLMETRSGRRLYEFEMSSSAHRRLLRVVMGIPAPVLISGYWSELYAETLKGWNSIHFQTTTRGGRPAMEWVWFNFAPPVELHDYRFLGENFRERERIKRKKHRWTARLARMPLLERQALLCALQERQL